MAPRIIRMTGITKRFQGATANERVNLEIKPGEIHALLGENGAGKTTLMNILSGRYRPDEGQIFVDEEPVKFHSPRDALRMGIGMVHQHFMLISDQTVAENILLGVEAPRVLLHPRKMEEGIGEFCHVYGLHIHPGTVIDGLSLGQQQRVEILKLLYRNVDVLILDEPTAVLTPSEIEELLATLRSITAEGKSVIFITHKLEEVMEIADRITILRRGRVIVHLTPNEVESRKELARLMVGREVVFKVEKRPVVPGRVVLELRSCSGTDWRGHPAFHGISFVVRRGEIFSIVGVAGNGQSELVAAIAGFGSVSEGDIFVLGRPHRPGCSLSLEEVAYIPEDRQGMGSVANLDLVDNLILTSYSRYCRRGFFRRSDAQKEAENLLPKFNIAASSVHAVARQLSGGNLQKVILARELSKNPQLIIAEQPTHGLDIGATEEVWAELLRQRETAGVLLVSGDLKEVLSLSDRIGVMFRGRLVDIFDAEDEDRVGEIGPMMAGLRQEQTA